MVTVEMRDEAGRGLKRLRQEVTHKFEASLRYIVRPYLTTVTLKLTPKVDPFSTHFGHSTFLHLYHPTQNKEHERKKLHTCC